MTPLRRALLLLGWVLLIGGPIVGALSVQQPDEAVLAYGATPPSRAIGALWGAVPGGFVAAVLFFVIVGRVRRSEQWRTRRFGAPFDDALLGASELAGFVLAAIGAVLVFGVMIFGGPIGIISGFALAILTFSLIGRGRRRAADDGTRPS